jgi:integrase
LTEAEARAFLAAARGDAYEALWVLLLTSGLRLGEALGLEWRDVDLDAGALVVRQAIAEVNGACIVGEPKTRSSRRHVALGKTAIAALRSHQKRSGRTVGFVFVDSAGGHPRRSNLRSRHFAPICERAGISGLTIHGLRHSMTSIALAKSIPVRAVSDALGHATTRMTQDRYGHAMPGFGRQVADALDSALKKRSR